MINEESISGLEEEIIEIEKVKQHCIPGSLQWNNIDSIIAEKKRKLSILKQGNCEADYMPGCGGSCER
ncbi:MAG: hypothetical protein C3F06_04425 [Candidatus Methanoperedenaceae archaeon]|nr:MAG: hypothetical protein C3F06_04425 [Candidatus Methanoperedenaceae archaeon]